MNSSHIDLTLPSGKLKNAQELEDSIFKDICIRHKLGEPQLSDTFSRVNSILISKLPEEVPKITRPTAARVTPKWERHSTSMKNGLRDKVPKERELTWTQLRKISEVSESLRQLKDTLVPFSDIMQGCTDSNTISAVDELAQEIVEFDALYCGGNLGLAKPVQSTQGGGFRTCFELPSILPSGGMGTLDRESSCLTTSMDRSSTQECSNSLTVTQSNFLSKEDSCGETQELSVSRPTQDMNRGTQLLWLQKIEEMLSDDE